MPFLPATTHERRTPNAEREAQVSAGPGSHPNLGYDRLCARIGLGMNTLGIGPVFQVSDLSNALKYYKEVRGFEEDFQFGAYAGVSHGDACLHLSGHQIHKRPIGGGAAFVFCDEVDDYFQQIKKQGAIVKVEPADQPYGMRDFIVLDPDGNHMTFGCEIRNAGVAEDV
jgi:uncharacterized glyoxalase superfamily protein PhnB